MAQKVQIVYKPVFQGGGERPSPKALEKVWLALAQRKEKREDDR